MSYQIGMPDVIQNIRISVVVQHIGSGGDADKRGSQSTMLVVVGCTVNTEAPCHSRRGTMKIPPAQRL